MRKYGIVFCSILIISPLHAGIYKWTDNNGVVHFSDKPHEGAKEVELPPAQLYTAPVSTGEKPALPNAPSEPAEVPEAPTYTVTFTQPEDQATIRNNQGYVPVIVEVTPELQADYKLQILLDGAPLGKPQATTVFALREINRGSHTLTVQVIDNDGEIISTSEPITFFMHRPTVDMTPKTSGGVGRGA